MIDAIKRSLFFAGFDDKTLGDVDAFTRTVSFEAGATIYDRDEEGHRTWILLSGHVLQGFEVSPGSEVWFQTAEAGDVIGFDALITPHVRSMRCKAAERIEAVEIDSDKLLEYLEANPRIGFIFMERLAQVAQQRLNNTRLQVIHLMPDREPAGPTL